MAMYAAAVTPLLFSAAAAQVVAEFRLPTANSGPNDIVAGPDGNLWFTERTASQIGRITPDGMITEFPLAADSQPYEIVAGEDGNLWFTERTANQIGRISPQGVLTEFPLATAGSEPCAMTAGPDGNLWFTECGASRVGRVGTDGTITEFALSGGIRGTGITTGPDGNVWLATGTTNRIARVNVASPNTATLFSVRGGPTQITTGPDGNLWFTEAIDDRIGRLTPSGKLVDFILPAPDSLPTGISAGPDGNVWFTERITGHIGRITPSGAIAEFAGHDFPTGITSGPDGSIWFTESGGSRVGRAIAPVLGCALIPATACRKPTVSRQAQVQIKSKTGGAKDSIAWQWAKGAATAATDFGDPLGTTSYALCVYDHVGGTASLVMSVTAPPGGACAGKPCWKALGTQTTTGFQYKAPSGILKIVLHAGQAGKAKITVTNAAANLPLPTLPLQQDPNVTVQLVSSQGVCWAADYSRPPVHNDSAQFKAKSD